MNFKEFCDVAIAGAQRAVRPGTSPIRSGQNDAGETTIARGPYIFIFGDAGDRVQLRSGTIDLQARHEMLPLTREAAIAIGDEMADAFNPERS